MRLEANVVLSTIPGKLHAVGMSNKLPREVGGAVQTLPTSTHAYPQAEGRETDDRR